MIKLVPLRTDHLDHVMTWVNDREVMQYFANRQTDITREEEVRYIEAMTHSKTDRVFSIFEDISDWDPATCEYNWPYVGQCSINQIYWPAKNGRLFVVIKKDAQGKGFARQAITELLRVAFEDMKLHKIWLITRQDNREAQALYLSLGFDFEGLLRQEYSVGGRYFDMVRMGVLNPHA